MTPNRKSIAALTKSGLRKCTQFYKDGVRAYCTPAEFYALCLYFECSTIDYEYYRSFVDTGECRSSNHYFHVKKFKDEFPKDYYYIDCYMSQPC